MRTHTFFFAFALGLAILLPVRSARAQTGAEMNTERGRLWETMSNDGFVSSLDDWDYLTYKPFGLFPGFKGWVHPLGSEDYATDAFANANMHHFRGGVWVIAKDFLTAGQPPTFLPMRDDYEGYFSGLQGDAYGGEDVLAPMTMMKNYAEKPGFNPLFPEEMTSATWNTATGITVTRRSSVFSYPGYRDFIIYDYVFRNTGKIVSLITKKILPDTVLAKINGTVNGVYFVHHSGVSVSTKSQINFHTTLNAVQAGAFGWKPPYYHDYFRVMNNGQLAFSLNYNGGKEPPWFDLDLKAPQEWLTRFGPELQSPAAFGWLSLYASPTGAAPRATPKPDVLRVDSHMGGKLNNKELNLQTFVPGSRPMSDFYTFASTPDTQATLGNTGNRFNFYTFSYGPYNLALGDSVRIVVAEIAGVMDMAEVNAGDPSHHYPDSTIAAILRNADNARNAVKWGMGATVGGVPIVADVPEPPPPPACDAVNASYGTISAKIAVVWDKTAETATFADGSGNVFYNGASDLAGYRIYKSQDFQFNPTGLPVFRGEAWTLFKDIPVSQAAPLFDATLGKYKLVDSTVVFGFRYGYYVAAYRSANPAKTWTSANGTVVTGMPELESGSVNKTLPASAAPGPVPTLDVFATPNPYVYGNMARSFGAGDPTIEFRNLPVSATIRIYTISGDLIRTLQHKPDARGNVFGSEVWDQKTDSGLLAAPGLYVYRVTSLTAGVSGGMTGKLMIIR
jgi:hypothetical protein